MKKVYLLIGFIAAFSVFILGTRVVLASDPSFGLDKTAGAAKLDTYGKDVPTIAGNIIGTLLSMISVLFFVLILYGGILWMTARGSSETTEKALNTIIAATIGIIIIIGAYALTNFVFKLGGNVGGGGGGSTPTATGAICGNVNTESGEQCDDGNRDNGDGCSSQCQLETEGCSNLSPEVCVEQAEFCDYVEYADRSYDCKEKSGGGNQAPPPPVPEEKSCVIRESGGTNACEDIMLEGGDPTDCQEAAALNICIFTNCGTSSSGCGGQGVYYADNSAAGGDQSYYWQCNAMAGSCNNYSAEQPTPPSTQKWCGSSDVRLYCEVK